MQVTILGITGGVGHAVANAFLNRGIPVVALVRDASRVDARPGLTLIEGDARDADALHRAMAGSDVVLHGLNLPYPDWDPGMVELTAGVLAAAEKAQATLLFPGNLYGLGPDFTEPMAEDASREPVSRKGALRNRLEEMLAASATQTIVLRAGDFFGGIGESSWMFFLTGRASGGGSVMYPADLGVQHCWAYLPDVAETFVELAMSRARLDAHATFHFEGHVVDGHRWLATVRGALGDERAMWRFPWMWMQLARPFVPMVRELFEMRYLWDEPVRMDGSALRAFLGTVPSTSFEEAIAHTLQPVSREAKAVA